MSLLKLYIIKAPVSNPRIIEIKSCDKTGLTCEIEFAFQIRGILKRTKPKNMESSCVSFSS